MQRYVERAPAAALADVVSSVWIQQIAPDAAPYLRRRVQAAVGLGPKTLHRTLHF